MSRPLHPHSHDHDHPHAGSTHDGPAVDHQHEPLDPELAQLGPTTAGTVMLDIGGDIGSLIISTGDELALAEIEVSLVGHDDDRTHIAIRERRTPAGIQWAGIFPGLQEGDYTVWNVDGTVATTVRITGGEVAQVELR